jgi:hypothetical protein
MAVHPVGKLKESTTAHRAKSSVVSKSASQAVGQRDSGAEAASGLLSLQQTIGNHAVRKLIQAKKLTVGPAHDKYEEEADQVANQVTKSNTNKDTSLQRKPLGQTITPLVKNEKALKNDGRLTRKAAETSGEGGFTVGGGVSRRLADSRGGGSPLPAETRTEMESKFGVDFNPVRIHTGNEASKLAQAVKAEAFTSGHDIYLNSGKYQPHSDKGKHLLAHELTHVVQQSAGLQRSGELGEARQDEQIHRKKIFRQFDFLKVRRKAARTVKQVLDHMKMDVKDTGDSYTHWWTEVGRTRDGWEPRQSYGMWPAKGPSDDPKGAGVPGLANAMGKTPRGRKERDPLHAEKTDDEFHPVVEVDQDLRYEKVEEDYAKQIKNFAHSYKGRWKWRSRWGTNTQNYHTALMRRLKMEIPKKKMPMLINPRVMLSREAQENMETAEEFGRTQTAFSEVAEKGGMPLQDMLSDGSLNHDDLLRAFDVTPEEQEARAQLLAQLNPQTTIDEILKVAQG